MQLWATEIDKIILTMYHIKGMEIGDSIESYHIREVTKEELLSLANDWLYIGSIADSMKSSIEVLKNQYITKTINVKNHNDLIKSINRAIDAREYLKEKLNDKHFTLNRDSIKLAIKKFDEAYYAYSAALRIVNTPPKYSIPKALT